MRSSILAISMRRYSEGGYGGILVREASKGVGVNSLFLPKDGAFEATAGVEVVDDTEDVYWSYG